MGAEPGEEGNLEAFCRAQFPRLVGLLSLYCGDRAIAEDLAQETLARVWRRWEHVRGLDAPELWARRVALNLASSARRRRRVASRTFAQVAGFAGSPADPPAEPGDFGHLVAGLPARQRAVLILRFYEDLSVHETARILRCREGTVKALTSQGIAALRRAGVAAGDIDDA